MMLAKFLKPIITIKKIFLFLLITMNSLHGMEIFSLSSHKDAIPVSSIIGISLIGVGIWQGFDAYFNLPLKPGQATREIEVEKIVNDSISTIGLGFSILTLFNRNYNDSYADSLIK